jgi:uncharacterized protein YuzB (UPF0349 family)
VCISTQSSVARNTLFQKLTSEYCDQISEFLDSRGIDYSTKGCLGRCDLCSTGAFIEREGEFIYEEDGDTLIDELLKVI